MLIAAQSKYLLKIARAKAKMIEYKVTEDEHVYTELGVEKLFLTAVAATGNIAAAILRDDKNSENIVNAAKAELEFSSKYFDAYLNSELDKGSEDYFLLLGAAAYFLCDYVGSSKVLIYRIVKTEINLNAHGIENALTALLQDSFEYYEVKSEDSIYKKYLDLLRNDLHLYYESGKIPNHDNIELLRQAIYEHGSDFELLIGDAFLAIYILKIKHSAINLLPQYMQLERSVLDDFLLHGNTIRELWPSQRRFGESGIFAGVSAVVQMPTSSGKTKAISLVIIAAFISQRTRVAVVIAPFRSLCHEISDGLEKDYEFDSTIHVDELSDILQPEKLGVYFCDEHQKTVLVATPEKMIYLLRQHSDLIEKIGLIIFDEGHLFDDHSRGIVYELLISTLKGLLQSGVQKILVSAVIPNCEELNIWLNGCDGAVISDNTIKSTERTLAITDWEISGQKHYGYLYFLNPKNPDEQEFYVPRLISINKLKLLGEERKERFFPSVDFHNSHLDNPNDIGIYYALKLCQNGGVGIFCGKKDSVNNILKRILEIESRGYVIDALLRMSDNLEVGKICKLIEENYGIDNIYYEAGKKAAFAHHAGISNGIRISVENAMRSRKINFIVCTSTLAQGVNLPIRYLIISNMYQGSDKLKVRDFHNLIGRAGRSGLFTEGSILLTESFIYNNRFNRKSKAHWKWEEYKKLINNKNSEPCSSRILFLIRTLDIWAEGIKRHINMKKIIIRYYKDIDGHNKFMDKLYMENQQLFNIVKGSIEEAISLLSAVESFLMGYLLEDTWEECEDKVQNIAKETLAYYLANDEEKADLLDLFKIIGKYCIENVPEIYQRQVCSKSLIGVKKMLYIKEWVEGNLSEVIQCKNTQELLNILFNCLINLLEDKTIKRLERGGILLEIGLFWIYGVPYSNIADMCTANKYRIKKKSELKLIELDDIIKICDHALSYDSALIVSAVSEVVKDIDSSKLEVLRLFNEVSSELKYGLPYGVQTIMYEIGFSDRVVAQKIAEYFNESNICITSKYEGRKNLKKYRKNIESIIIDYPSIFADKLNSI